jgi:hypothetical protein
MGCIGQGGAGAGAQPTEAGGVAGLKGQRQRTRRPLGLKDLPDRERLRPLATTQTRFVGPMKLMAYEAEAALVALRRPRRAPA